MKQVLLFISLVLFSAYNVFASDDYGTIHGKVITSDDHPAASVTVQLKGIKKITVTNDKGEFVFKNVTAGIYEVQLSSIGYTTLTKQVSVEAGKTATIDFQLSESAAELAEVVVSTNRKSYIAEKPSTSLRLNAPLIEIPQNITVATKQTLTDMGLLTKSEIFRISSGITKSYGNELDLTFQIRGINSTYGTYRNGVGGPIWWNAQEDASMIERMEFVKGPAGFMLANAEPGGLVNVVTKQPSHQRIAEVGFGLGSWNLMRTNVDLGGEVKKDGKFLYRLNIGAEQKNDYYHFGDFYRYWFCPVITYEFSDKTSLTYEFNYVKAATQENAHQAITINGDFKKLPVDLAINDPNNPKFWGADVYNKLTLKHKLNDDWAINAQAAYMTTDWDGQTMYLQGINATKDSLDRENFSSNWTGKLTNLQVFMDGHFTTGRHAEHKVLIGIDYGKGNEGSTYDNIWENNPFPLSIKSPTYYLPKDTLNAFHNPQSWISTNRWQAVYIQDHLKLFNKLIVTLAGRVTHLTTGQDYNDPDDPQYEITDTKFTPRLGLTYLFSDNVSAYALHDESFLPQRGAIYGGGRLPPLTGSNDEVGVKALLFKKQLSITVSVYDIKKNDVGTSDMVHPGFYLKTGQIRSQGLDFDIAGRINANVYINANYAYANARITKDEDKTIIGIQNEGTCKHLANVWLKYQVTDGVLKGLGIGAGYQYTDKRGAIYPGWNSTEGNKYLPSYNLLDAAVSYSIGRFGMSFNMYNLANKRYGVGGDWYPDYQEYIFYQGTPRNFRLQTTVRL
ncbi:MAG: TonB-dependent siderophore receptor [Agriterribacter sp.]